MNSSNDLRHIVGKKMTSKFISVFNDESIGNIKKLIFTKAKEFDIIDYIYVVDKQNKLDGVISLKEILQLPDEVEVKNKMIKQPISIGFHIDQERLVYLVIKHDLKAVPVVDTKHCLKGIVPYSEILKIFHREFREDILQSGGIHHQIKEIEAITTPVSKLVLARFPSLFLGLFGGLLAAYVVTGFEQVVGSYLTIAAFIPVLVYLSDAVGTQSQTLIVRMIALEPDFSTRRYITRELKIGVVLGVVFSILLFAAAIFGWGEWQIGVIVAPSILLSIIFQSFVATYLSSFLLKIKIDPALTSGPLTTIISDITSIMIYFSIASIMLSFLK